MIFQDVLQLLLVVFVALLVASVVGIVIVVRARGEREGGSSQRQTMWHSMWFGVILATLAIMGGVLIWSLQTKSPGTPIPDEHLEDAALRRAILTYLETKVDPGNSGEKAFCAYRLFGGYERPKEGSFVYIWVMCGGFVAGKKESQSGGSYPLALRVAAKPWRVLGHQAPGMGSDFVPSVKRIFPRRFHARIFPGSLGYQQRARALIAQNQARARRYFAASKKPASRR